MIPAGFDRLRAVLGGQWPDFLACLRADLAAQQGVLAQPGAAAEDLRRAAHVLKALAGTVEHAALAAAAQRLHAAAARPGGDLAAAAAETGLALRDLVGHLDRIARGPA
jgi:HPt (histidine-containing phosphotransfer) domain-containing protein